MKTKTIKCHFKNKQNFTLDARLDVPKDFEPDAIDKIKAFVIFCHCFTCSKETITTYRISRLLAEQGYAVLRFDFMGLGGSEGDFSSTTFSSTQDDLNSAIHFLTENYQAPTFLMGHSLGGTTALSVAQNHNNIKGVVTIASPSAPEHVLHHFGPALTLLEQDIAASFEVAGEFYDIEPQFVEDVRSVNMQSILSALEKPILIFNIENDALVDETNAREIEQWSKGETTLVTLKDTNHLLSNKTTTVDVAERIVDWMNSAD